MRKLTKIDFERIVLGSSFYGGGGGGSADEGFGLIKEMLKVDPNASIDMYDISEVEDDPNVVSTMVAALGSPVATKGRTFQDESTNSVIGMGEEAKAQGKTLKYVYSGEQGGGNTMLPLYAAWRNGLPIIDTDGNGRAVPELNTGLTPVHGIATSPVVLASEKGDTIVGRTKDPFDSKSCETIARYMCQAYDQGIGFAAWMMNKEDHLKSTAIGQMTVTIDVGEIFADNPGPVAIEKLEAYYVNKGEQYKTFIKAGTITDMQIDSAGGFDTGVTTIKDDETGKEYKVTFQNENLFVEDEAGEVLITIPGIISVILLDDGTGHAKAISNSETKVGQKVALVAVNAHEKWYDVPECYGCWNDVMVSAGYGEGDKAKPEVRL
ncbi:DUF917 family protein [Clostridiales Family XIII bacterium PM5-7]